LNTLTKLKQLTKVKGSVKVVLTKLPDVNYKILSDYGMVYMIKLICSVAMLSELKTLCEIIITLSVTW